jgi:hypothetical protein
MNVKVRFDVAEHKFERVMGDNYLIYVHFSQSADADKRLVEIISKKMGVVSKNISFLGRGKNGEWIFEVA